MSRIIEADHHQAPIPEFVVDVEFVGHQIHRFASKSQRAPPVPTAQSW